MIYLLYPFLVILDLFIGWFREWPPQSEDVAGKYVAYHDKGEGEEYIQMNADYTFIHYFRDVGKPHIEKGTWDWYLGYRAKKPCLNLSNFDIYLPETDRVETAVNFCVNYNRYTIHVFPGHDDRSIFYKEIWGL